ncbi:MAG: CpaF family protein [Bdellovibrionaceae bacterium]|nr:CpaF family protein [Pseudobdellovibrionaceae bacterium]
MKSVEEIDPILVLINDEEVTEIMMNSHSEIYYEKKGPFLKWNSTFTDLQKYKYFIQRLCQKAKIQYDFNCPFADGYLHPFRIHLIAPPLTKNVQLTLRRHKEVPWTLSDLEFNNWAESSQITFIKQLVKQKENILIIGPTGTGKTSCLNALIQSLPESERVVIIEDTHELRLPNSISTQLLTRHDLHGNLRSFTQEDLLKQALRMRPNRIILGEVRGREAKDYLLTLSTGHKGSLCSLHAEDARQALLRIEMLVKMGAPEWDNSIIRNLIFLSLNYIITLEISKEGNRKLKNLYKIAGMEANGLTLSKIF